MIALIIIIGYLIGFFTTVKLLKKKSSNASDNDKMAVVMAGILFPCTLVAVTVIYIGHLMVKFYDWL